MFPPETYRELFAHMEWADAAVWTAVLGTDPALQDQPLRDLLVHLHSVQQAFLDVWSGRPFRFRDAAEFIDMQAVHAMARPYYAGVREFVNGTDQPAIDDRLILPWVAPYEQHLGRTFAPTTLGNTMYQVVAHTNHHRGQVNYRLRAVGGTPPNVDYIVWVFLGKPAADWSAGR